MKLNSHHIHARAADMGSIETAAAGLSVAGSVTPKKSTLSNAVFSAISISHPSRFILPILSCAVPSLVFAGPEGGQVIAGSATISNPDANSTLITQSTSHAAIDWQRFNIGSQEYVQFAQPDASSVALNRVIGGDPSQILGNLSANGQVFLVNPNGVYFGQSATVDVGGIVASVNNIRNEDFMSGNYVFSKSADGPDDVGVVNDGVITARDGGYVVLMGDYVHNNGIISARLGTVALAAGNQITMDVKGNGLVSVVIDEATLSEVAGVSNTGDIIAAGGRVMMNAKVANDLVDTAINNEGLVVANGIAERNGVIFLTAAGGDVVNSGTLDASAADGSNVDGGGVLVYSDKDVINAAGAEIRATGDGSGDGGVVRVIADEFMGHQSGALIDVTSDNGDGGFVEVSGHGSLAIRGDIDIGNGGELLIDPSVLIIDAGGGSPGSVTSSVYAVGETFIEGQLNAGVDVTLVASDSINASATLSIDALNVSAGDLAIKIGTVGFVSGTGSLDWTTNCFSAGVCSPGSSGTFTADTNGSINLGNVSFNLAGGLNVAGGTAIGTVSLGGINAGGDVSITAGDSGSVKLTGNTITAGGNVLLDGDIGSLGSGNRRAADLTINAGDHININSDIYLANNKLELFANTNGDSVGDVNINGQAGDSVNIDTKGSISVSGQNFNIIGATNAGGSGAATSQVFVKADNAATTTDNITVVVAGAMNVSGGTGTAFAGDGSLPLADVSVNVIAGNDINITADSLNVSGGNANGFVTSGFGSPSITANANASLSAGHDVVLGLTGNLNVDGGIADASISFSSFGGNGRIAKASVAADAMISAVNEVRVNSAGGSLSVLGGSANATANVNLGCSVCTGTNGPEAFATANADASITAGIVTISNVANGINVSGGTSVNANAIANSLLASIAAIADANAQATAAIDGGTVNITNVSGNLAVNGGAVTSNTSGNGIKTVATNAGAKLHADTNLTVNVTSGDVNVIRGAGVNTGSEAIISAGAVANIAMSNTINATGRVAAGNDLIVSAGGNFNVQGNYSAGNLLALSAAGSLDLNTDLGTISGVLNNNVSLSAGNNVNINNNIFLANNFLTLAADTDGAGGGDVNITGSTIEERTIQTQGLMTVTGANFNVKGADFGTGSVSNDTTGSLTAVTVQVDSLTANISNQVVITGGQVNIVDSNNGTTGGRDVSVSVNATNDINITAAGLTVRGGSVTANGTSYSTFITAQGDANLSAGNDINIAVSGNLTVAGGIANATHSFYSTGYSRAFANAEINAGNNVNITNVGGVMTIQAGPAGASMNSIVSGTGSAVARSNAGIRGTNITVGAAGSLNIFRGKASATIQSFSSGNYSASASANASLVATQAVNLSVTGDINLTGGTGVSSNTASASANSNGSPGVYAVNANADILIQGTNVTINSTSGNLTVAGGNAVATATSSGAAITHSINASAIAEINATALVDINVGGSADFSNGTESAAVVTLPDVITADARAVVNAGTGLSVIAGADLVVHSGSVTAGTDMLFSAGGSLDMNIDLGTSGSALSHDVTLRSDFDVNIVRNIFLANNTLTLAADADGDGVGDVNVTGSTIEARTVQTLGNMTVTGANFNVKGADFGSTGVSISADRSMNVAAASLTVNLSNDMTVSGGRINLAVNLGTSGAGGTTLDVDTSVSVSATNAVSITAGNLTIQGGIATASVSGASYSSDVVATAGAEITAGSDLSLTLTGGLTVKGGNATAAALSTGSSSDIVSASADALLKVTGAGNVTINAATSVVLDNGVASATSTGSGSAAATANAVIQAGNNVVLSAGGNIGSVSAAGNIFAGGSLSASAGGNYFVNDFLSVGGSSLLLSAGSNLDLNVNLGSGSSTLNNNVSLSAGNNVNINNNIFLANNSLTLAADTDGNGVGDVNIVGILEQPLSVMTQGSLSVSGQDFNVIGASSGSVGYVSGSFPANVTVSAANNLAISLGGNLNVTAGNVFLQLDEQTGFRDVSVSLTAGNDVTVTAVGLNVAGGLARVEQSIARASNGIVKANAEFVAGNNMTLNLSGNLSVQGGSASASQTEARTATIIAEANAKLVATNSLTLNVLGDLKVTGGSAIARNSVDTSAVIFGVADAQANAEISADNIQINSVGGVLEIKAGTATADLTASTGCGSVNNICSAGASANAGITGANVTVSSVGAALTVQGGSATANPGTGAGTVSASAIAQIAATGSAVINVTGGSVTLTKGIATPDGTSGSSPIRKGNADAVVKAGALNMTASTNITGNGADISAAGMYMSAGSNIDLVTSNISVGNGTVAGVNGDAITLAFLATQGIPLPTTANPNAKFSAGGTLNLGTITMDGDIPYLWMEADVTNIGGLVLPTASDVVVQYSPFTLTKTINVEDQPVATNSFVNYNNLEHFSILPGTTIIIGSSLHTGEVLIGGVADVDIVAKNMVAVTASNITSIDNVISTGIVAELQLGFAFPDDDFVTPILTEVEVGLLPVDDPAEEKEKKKNLVKDDEEEIKMCEAG